MFSGIVEGLGIIDQIEKSGSNYHFWLKADFVSELKIDQSIAHNGVCLTVDQLKGDHYRVTAIEETISKTNLSQWEEGSKVNLERCIRMNDRLDGHIVQGHVDGISKCTGIQELEGSWLFTFSLEKQNAHLVVPQGSICINGVSLTVARLEKDSLSVAIIPYTYEHTNFSSLRTGDLVNFEYDIIGKYINRREELKQMKA